MRDPADATPPAVERPSIFEVVRAIRDSAFDAAKANLIAAEEQECFAAGYVDACNEVLVRLTDLKGVMPSESARETDVHQRNISADGISADAGVTHPADNTSPAAVERIAPLEWRCFFCDEVFTDQAEAQEHFGREADYPTPACRLSTEDVKHLRGFEAANSALRAENDRLDNDARLYHELYADVQRLTHGHGLVMELDYRDGEKLVLQEHVAGLTTRLAALQQPTKVATNLRQGCTCQCCDHGEGSDCACDCHRDGLCSYQAGTGVATPAVEPRPRELRQLSELADAALTRNRLDAAVRMLELLQADGYFLHAADGHALSKDEFQAAVAAALARLQPPNLNAVKTNRSEP